MCRPYSVHGIAAAVLKASRRSIYKATILLIESDYPLEATRRLQSAGCR